MDWENNLNVLKKGYVKIHLGDSTYRVRLLTLVLFGAALLVLIAAILVLILAHACAPAGEEGGAAGSPSAPAASASASVPLPAETPGSSQLPNLSGDASLTGSSAPSESPDASAGPSASPDASGSDDFVTIELNANEARVAEVQQKLIDLYYMVYPDTKDGKPTTTTFFGSITSAAVRVFQSRNDLPETGKVDKATYDKLMSKGAKAYIMHQGDKCDMVKQIQLLLKEKGYLEAEATGQCGEKTIEAVKAFQKAKGLTQDGNAGPGTLKELLGY